MNDRTLLLTPMRSEVRPIVRSLSARRGTAGGREVWNATPDGHQIVASVIGVGTEEAARATAELLAAVAPDRAIVCGIAGGIAPGIALGTTVVPDRVVDVASGKEHWPDFAAGSRSEGALGTTDELILDPERLAGLVEQGMVALDMETAAVAAVCAANDCPWSVIRTISDRPSDGLLGQDVLGLLKPDGSTDTVAAARFAVTHPRRAAQLSQLAKDSTRAARQSAEVAIRACVGG